jgi:hypothetical protein
MGQFKYTPKMESDEEKAVLKLKKGGKVKMMDGGVPPAAVAAMANRQMGALPPTARKVSPPAMPMTRPVPQGALMRKKGGEVESKAMQAKEDREIKGIKKELKAHENKPASKGHKGLKTGGVITKDKTKTGSVEQFRGGYKKGGKARMAGGGSITNSEAELIRNSPGSLTPATRAMAERAGATSNFERNLNRPKPSMGSSPSDADIEIMRRQLADQKMDDATNAGYNRTYGKKTGGVMKKYADGGYAKMACKDGGGFKAMKKGNC